MILFVEPVIQHWFLIASILAFELNLSEQKSRGNSSGTPKSFQSAGKEPLMIEWENYFCNDPPERLSQSLAGSPSPCNICTEGKPGPGLNWAKMKANKVRSREHDRNPTQGTKPGLKCCLSTRKESLGTRTVYGCYCHARIRRGEM